MSTVNLEKLKVYAPIVYSQANKLTIDGDIILAIIWAESRGNPWAIRFEPAYYNDKKFYLSNIAAGKLGISTETEQTAQCFSWGLMQIMGVVARENGFTEELNKLCIPENGIYWGMNHFYKYFLKYQNMDAAISSYNQGSPRKNINGQYLNQSYVDEVNEYLKDIKNAHF